MSAAQRFNGWLADKITAAVGTMACAYVFAAIALVSLPQAVQDALHGNPTTLVQWTAQTFLQLVLLSIIIVGQNRQSERSELRAIETHDLVKAEFDILHDSHADLHAKVDALTDITDKD